MLKLENNRNKKKEKKYKPEGIVDVGSPAHRPQEHRAEGYGGPYETAEAVGHTLGQECWMGICVATLDPLKRLYTVNGIQYTV